MAAPYHRQPLLSHALNLMPNSDVSTILNKNSSFVTYTQVYLKFSEEYAAMHVVSMRHHNLTIAQLHDSFMCMILTDWPRLYQKSALTTQFFVTFVIFHTWHSTFYSCVYELTPTFQMLNFLRLNSFVHQMATAYKFHAAMILSLHSENKPVFRTPTTTSYVSGNSTQSLVETVRETAMLQSVMGRNYKRNVRMA
jgi:hypothetical protein